MVFIGRVVQPLCMVLVARTNDCHSVALRMGLEQLIAHPTQVLNGPVFFDDDPMEGKVLPGTINCAVIPDVYQIAREQLTVCPTHDGGEYG